MTSSIIAADFDRARQEMLIDLDVLASLDPRAAEEAIADILADMQKMLAEEGQQ